MNGTPPSPPPTSRLTNLAAPIVAVALLAGCGGEIPDQEPDSGAWSVDCGDPSGPVAADFDIKLECLGGGGEIPLGATDGKPLVITLWASWCGPCRDEATAFRRLHDKVGEQVRVLGVDSRDDKDAALSFASDFEMEYPSVYDRNGETMREAGISALPATFLIDADGRTVATYREGDLTGADLLAAVEEHFGVKP